METLWKEPPGGSRAFWTVSRARKNTQNDPNAALREQGAPCHCPQHHPPAVTVTRQAQGCGLAPPAAPSVPRVPGRARPQGGGTGSSPLHREGQSKSSSWEAPGGTLLSDPGEKGEKGHPKDGINAAFLPHSLGMCNSLLTVPKSYRDPLNINFHITRSSPSPTTFTLEYPTASQAVFLHFQSSLPTHTRRVARTQQGTVFELTPTCIHCPGV